MAKTEETKKTPAKTAKSAGSRGKAATGGKAKSTARQPAKAKAGVAKPKAKSSAKGGHLPRLKAMYRGEITPALMKNMGYHNVWQVPRLEKIVLNMGLGNAREDANMLKGALDDLGVITGQKAVVTYAKKPISNFKIREKDPVGAKVTLRNNQMYEFLDRLVSLAIPRVRDFRGLPNRSFDGRGNYTFGVTEQIIFPEINYDKIDRIRGMDITLVTTAKTDEEAYELIRAFGFPFRPKPTQSQSSNEGVQA